MERAWLLGALLTLHAAVAGGATLSVTPDKATYVIGETVTLTVFGDPVTNGDQANFIFGQLLYSAALTGTVSASQVAHTSNDGAQTWPTGTLTVGDGFATVLNQECGCGVFGQATVDQHSMATAILIAEAIGTVDVVWRTTADVQGLHYFGLTNAPGTSFLIVPEPVTGTLLSLGLLGLAIRRRAPAEPYDDPDAAPLGHRAKVIGSS